MLKASNDEQRMVAGLAAITNDLDNTIDDGIPHRLHSIGHIESCS